MKYTKSTNKASSNSTANRHQSKTSKANLPENNYKKRAKISNVVTTVTKDT